MERDYRALAVGLDAAEEMRMALFVRNALIMTIFWLLSGVCLFQLSGHRYYLFAWILAALCPIVFFFLQAKLYPSKKRLQVLFETLLFCLFLFLTYCPAPSSSGFSGDGLRCELYGYRVEVGSQEITIYSSAAGAKESVRGPNRFCPVLEVGATNARGQNKRILMAAANVNWRHLSEGRYEFVFRRPRPDPGGFVLRKLTAVTLERLPRSFADGGQIEQQLDAPIFHLRSILFGRECDGPFVILHRVLELFPSKIDEYWIFDEGRTYLQESDGQRQSFGH